MFSPIAALMISRFCSIIGLILLIPASIFAQTPFLEQDGIQDLSVQLEHCIKDQVDKTECIGTFSIACLQTSKGQTTQGMMLCQTQEADAWDILLNHYYQITKTKLENYNSQDRNFVPEGDPSEVYQNAQRAWLAFRSAEIEKELLIWYGGSGSQVFSMKKHLDLTAMRTIELFSFCRSIIDEPDLITTACLLYSTQIEAR